MILSHIAAMSKNRVIGTEGKLPWNLPDDLRFFKEKTKGHIVIMGRKTFESLPKPLPNRLNVVITRQQNYCVPEGVKCFSNIQEALKFSEGQTEKWGEEVFIIGGGEIYKQTLEQAHYLYLTEIQKEFDGDAHYPEVSEQFVIAQKEDRFDPMNYSFCTYSRREL